MKISEILKKKEVTVSFEVFPPKKWDKIEDTKAVVRELCDMKPSWMSVTFGAGGTTAGFTQEIANEIEKDGVPALFHLTCVTSSVERIREIVGDLKKNGIQNVLALRGDIPEGFTFPSAQYFTHAGQLIREIKAIDPEFCVGGACYPEIHPESKNRVEDIHYLKEKVDCGLDFLTTQMFFDNEKFLDFREMCAIKGIDVPIIAGIMPITNVNLIKRSIALSNSSLPKKFYKIMERFGDDPEKMKQAGIVYATEQIIDLMANGVNNVHVYTMNKPDVARQIIQGLSHIIRG